jgi:hypothetical protein
MSTKVYLVFDGRMALHAPLPESESSVSEHSSIGDDDDNEDGGQENHLKSRIVSLPSTTSLSS